MGMMKRSLLNYAAYRYLWPPRPEGAIPVPLLAFYENRKWWAQVKKNGTCTLIFCCGDEVIFKGRHENDLASWTPLPEHKAFFAGRERWHVYVAELLHSKTAHIKNQLYLFDILVWEGEHLVGYPFSDRQDMLHERFGWERPQEPTGLGEYRVSPYITIAKTFDQRFNELWEQLRAEDEGLVLKNPDALLAPCTHPTANASWQVKCRRDTKNYSF